MQFDFEFADEIVWQIELLNEVFRKVEAPPLFTNSDFLIDEASAGPVSLRIALARKERNIVPLHMILETDEFRLDVDWVAYSFAWSFDDLIKSKEKVINLLSELFTSHIMVEHYSFRSNLYLLDPNQDVLDYFTIKDFGSLHRFWKGQRVVKSFLPIYDKPSEID